MQTCTTEGSVVDVVKRGLLCEKSKPGQVGKNKLEFLW